MSSVQESVAVPRRELSLRDLVFFDICAVVSLRWVAAAAHAGASSLVLWVIAAICFFLPSAITVSGLSRRFPQEGGMYLWTKHAFGDRHAFLCGWFYFTATLLYFPSLVLAGVSMTVYAFGPSAQSLVENRSFSLSITLAVLWAAFAANFFGMKVAKWISALGASSTFIIGAIICALGLTAALHSGSASKFHALPAANLKTVNFWSQIAFAFIGLELAPVVSGEIRNPRRDLPRAAIISGIISTFFYLAVTFSLLLLLTPENISPLTGLIQAGAAGAQKLGVPIVANILAALIGFALAGQLDTWIAGNTRLPYAVGLDRYLPAAFVRIHPRWGTPYVSLLAQAVVATLFLLIAQLGETVRAAYQIMVDMMVIVTFIPFLYIFGAGFRFVGSPKVAAARRQIVNELARPSGGALDTATVLGGFIGKTSALFGVAVTLTAIVLSAVPPAESGSAIGFEIKVVGGTLLFGLLGWAIFRRYERRCAAANTAN